MPTTRPPRTRSTSVSRTLARDRLGIPAVLFFVLAGVAPLTVAAGVIPTAYQTTGLTGIPAGFPAIAVVLGIFAVGYVAMSRQITSSGSFYAFISHGLGRPGRRRRGLRAPGSARPVVGVGIAGLGHHRGPGPAAG